MEQIRKGENKVQVTQFREQHIVGKTHKGRKTEKQERRVSQSKRQNKGIKTQKRGEREGEDLIDELFYFILMQSQRLTHIYILGL